jgi:hypothetical protein
MGSGIIVSGGKAWTGVHKLRSRNEKTHIWVSNCDLSTMIVK